MSSDNSPTNDERLAELAAIEARHNARELLGTDVPALIKEVRRLGKLCLVQAQDLYFREKLVVKFRTEVDKLKAEENYRLELVSHAVDRVLKTEEDIEVVIMSGQDGVSGAEFRSRGSSEALKNARELGKARLKVVELGRRMRAADKGVEGLRAAGERIGPELVARDQASSEWEEAMDTLDKLEATNDLKTPQSGQAGRAAQAPVDDRELQEARMKVVEAVQKMRQINKEYDDDATVHKTAKNELESALHALEELERRPLPKAEANPLNRWNFKVMSQEGHLPFISRRSAEEAPAPADYKGPWRAVFGHGPVPTALAAAGAPTKPSESLASRRSSPAPVEDKASKPAPTVMDAADLAAAGTTVKPMADADIQSFLREQYKQRQKREILEEAHAQVAKKEAQIAKQADMMAVLISQIADLRAQRDAALDKASEPK